MRAGQWLFVVVHGREAHVHGERAALGEALEGDAWSGQSRAVEGEALHVLVMAAVVHGLDDKLASGVVARVQLDGHAVEDRAAQAQ